MKTYHSFKKLSGHAGLMFVMIFPALFGMFVWSTDGARMLQSDARLTDAMEVAVLAVAASASDLDDDRQKIAKQFVSNYFSDVSANNVTVTSSKSPKTETTNGVEKRFYEYSLNVTVKRDTLFPNDTNSYISYGDEFSMKRKATARKGLSEAVDVILVADYSASMYETWTGGSQRKFKDLNDIIDEIADELDAYNKQNPLLINKIAVVGFDFYTSQLKDVVVEQCSGKGKKKECWNETVSTRYFSHHLVCKQSSYLTKDCRNGYGTFQENIIRGGTSYIDAQATVDNLFDADHLSNQYNFTQSEVTNISVFEDISLSTDFTWVKNRVNSSSYFNIPYKEGSGTSSYAGIIRAAQIANTGTNPRRLIILLSDGVDSYSSITDMLIDKGLCTKIVSELEKQVVNGKNVRAELAAIGFDYNVSANPQMKNCVGEGKVFKAQNRDDIKNKILSLISEEVGNLVR